MGYKPDLLAEQGEDRDERPLRDEHVGLIRERVGISSSRTWVHLVDRVLDQSSTNSCVGQSLSTAIYLRGAYELAMGIGPGVARPSALWSYGVARWKDSAGALVDDGCRPRQALYGAQEHGIVSDARWPFDPADVNVAPPFDLDLAGADALLTGWYSADGDANTADAMRAALDVGHFPIFAIDVYENFFEYHGLDVYSQPAGAWRGQHMLTAIAYRPGAIGFLNSWGADAHDGGFGWFADDFIRSHYTKQRLVVTAAPASR